MKSPDFIQPKNKIAAEHSAHILLRNIAFGAIEGKLLGGLPGNVLDYRTPQVCVTWSKQDDTILAIFPFTLVVETKHESNGLAEAIADISVLIHIEYKLVEKNGTIPMEHLPDVIGILGYMHAWPYFRADVQWLTTKLGFPPLVLPVVLSGEVGDRVVVRRYPIGQDLTMAMEAGTATESAPALPAVGSSEPEPKLRRKRQSKPSKLRSSS